MEGSFEMCLFEKMFLHVAGHPYRHRIAFKNVSAARAE